MDKVREKEICLFAASVVALSGAVKCSNMGEINHTSSCVLVPPGLAKSRIQAAIAGGDPDRLHDIVSAWLAGVLNDDEGDLEAPIRE